MDILKLIYEHDMVLRGSLKDQDARKERRRPSTLEEFMRPVPTYSRFYITGTRLDDSLFGIDKIDHAGQALSAISESLQGLKFITTDGENHENLLSALTDLPVGGAIVAFRDELKYPVSGLAINDHEQLQDRIPAMLEFLNDDHHILYKENARDGFDLHIFSRRNLYEPLFYALKPLIGPELRLFSINGKRMKSERFFYFETYRIDRPPHGFEEVLPTTIV